MPSAAGLVLNDDLLADIFRELSGHDPGHRIEPAAGGKRHNPADHPIGKFRIRRGDCRTNRGQPESCLKHAASR
jgi:hypothetical protein